MYILVMLEATQLHGVSTHRGKFNINIYDLETASLKTKFSYKIDHTYLLYDTTALEEH